MRSEISFNATAKRMSGFSLIELMVVVGIISILASLALPRMQENAKQGVAEVELKKILNQINRVRTTEEKTLLQLTGHTCSSCACRSAITTTCENRAKSAFEAIYFASGWKSKVYGGPFMIDENEGESHWSALGEDCILDSIAVCDLKNKQAYVSFLPGHLCAGYSQFDAADDEGEALEDIATLFTCER